MSGAPNATDPAFPNPEASFADFGNRSCYTGLTMRDYFASDAMAALLSCKGWRENMDADQTARAAYRQADAMLKARCLPEL